MGNESSVQNSTVSQTASQSTNADDLSKTEKAVQLDAPDTRTQTVDVETTTVTGSPSSADLSQEWSLREAVNYERPIDLIRQSSLPFFIAGLGSIFAGQVLSYASTTELFKKTPALLALSTPLMGLKGNLDMTYASRLTTLAHLGALQSLKDVWKRLPVFLATVQTQAILMAIFSSIITFAIIWPKKIVTAGGITAAQFIPLITSSSLLTVCTSAGLMCFLTTMLVYISRKCRFNPDNVTVPLAASIGDLFCVSLLFGFATLLEKSYRDSWCASYVVIIIFLALLPCWAYYVWMDESARVTLKFCWFSLVLSSLLQCAAGALLDAMARKYPDCTLYQPILSGIGGNRVAVLASRISSFLHSKGNLKTRTFPENRSLWRNLNPLRFFYSCDNDAKCSRVLIIGSLPYQLVFIFVAYVMALHLHTTDMPPKFRFMFVVGYIIFAFIQIGCLMLWGQLTCYLMWWLGVDPDTHAIPLLTGCALLFVLFTLIDVIHPDSINIIGITDSTSTTMTAMFSSSVITI
ncbi:unnamed protein product, partial [Mesorhabditis belari]|uniref:SLC41A/MgtE integral membrane domain-containing protein n=1 Tax=Mesorhabditis belari TaxID=2138241 RepID=A0AAF3J4Y6_9BILA